MPTEYINVHTHRPCDDALCMVSYGLGRDAIPADSARPFSAGIHPWDAAGISDEKLREYLSYLGTAPVAAIGEAGLDYAANPDRDRQTAVFVSQIEIAAARRLPVVVHCVKAYNDLLPIIKKYPAVYFILHGYTGSHELTARLVDAGCYFSIGERSLGSEKTAASLALIPSERIFAETDESPMPIGEVYRRLANALGIDIEGLQRQIKENYQTLFTI